MARELQRPEDVRAVLLSARTVAVLGAHHEPERAAFYVPEYLYRVGYRVIPVNPVLVGERLWGEPVRARLDQVEEPVDVVDVFRRPDALPAHLPELLGMRPLPRVAWLQSGIRHPRVTAALVEAGVDVIVDRCMYADHRAWRLPPVPR